jgi:WD40 repeat protein
VASASEDQAVKLWDLETGECLHTFLGHTYGLRGVTFAEEGQTLVTVSADECIKWWDVQSGQCRRTVRIPRPYEGLKIKGVTGLTEAARATLLALGADDQE